MLNSLEKKASSALSEKSCVNILLEHHHFRMGKKASTHNHSPLPPKNYCITQPTPWILVIHVNGTSNGEEGCTSSLFRTHRLAFRVRKLFNMLFNMLLFLNVHCQTRKDFIQYIRNISKYLLYRFCFHFQTSFIPCYIFFLKG